MPVASALRAEKVIAERNRGAHPCVAQLASSLCWQGVRKRTGIAETQREDRQNRSKSMRKSSTKSGAGAQQ
eukprot:scaffold81645_cov69-Phaeocystis_antarctica.AAC.2